MPDRATTATAPKLLLLATSFIPVAGGLLALLGWQSGLPALRGFPGSVGMAPNTALCLVLGGLALWWLYARSASFRWRAAGYVFAFIVFTVGSITVAEHATSRDLGIDRLLFSNALAQLSQSPHPGRSAPNTAVAVSLLGAALLLSEVRLRGRRPAELLAALAGLVSFFGLMGYVYDVRSMYSVTAASTMALHTAIYLGLLAVGLIFMRTDGRIASLMLSRSASGIVTRRILLTAMVVFPLLGWLRLKAGQLGLISLEAGIAWLVLSSLVFLALAMMRTVRILQQFEADRKKAEDAVREANTELAAIVDSSPVATILFDLDRTVRRFNPAAERLLGWRQEEVIGKALPVARDQQIQWQGLAQVLRAGRSFASVETKRVRKDGSIFEALISGAPLRDVRGEITGFVGVLEDLTERRQAEQLRHTLEHEKMAARIAHSLAHEVNNPLEILANCVYLLQLAGNSADSQNTQFVAVADDAVKRMTQITRELIAACSGRAVDSARAERIFGSKLHIDVLLSVLESLHDAVLVGDENGKVIFLNRSARELYGTPPSNGPESCAENFGVFDAAGTTRLKDEDLPLYRALSGESPHDVELVVRPPMRDEAWRVAASAAPLRAEDGKILGAFVVCRRLRKETSAPATLKIVAPRAVPAPGSTSKTA